MTEARHQQPAQSAASDPEHRTPLDVSALGLHAFLFDLDGVVTRTASLHAQAWRQLFDEFLAERAPRGGHVPFRLPADYVDFVDGKPRAEGVRSFLRSRGIDLPFGDPSDAPGAETICGVGNRKNRLFQRVLEDHGVEVFDGALTFIRQLRAVGIQTACVSSSKNCRPVLERAQLTGFFDLTFDGHDLEREELRGKPHPDCFLRAAELLGAEPSHAAVVEDALVGVAAGRSGRFGLVIGVDRGAGREALLRAGADLVVSDLSDLTVDRAPR